VCTSQSRASLPPCNVKPRLLVNGYRPPAQRLARNVTKERMHVPKRRIKMSKYESHKATKTKWSDHWPAAMWADYRRMHRCMILTSGDQIKVETDRAANPYSPHIVSIFFQRIQKRQLQQYLGIKIKRSWHECQSVPDEFIASIIKRHLQQSAIEQHGTKLTRKYDVAYKATVNADSRNCSPAGEFDHHVTLFFPSPPEPIITGFESRAIPDSPKTSIKFCTAERQLLGVRVILLARLNRHKICQLCL
jgi:hypothetical protein